MNIQINFITLPKQHLYLEFIDNQFIIGLKRSGLLQEEIIEIILFLQF